MPPLIVWNFVFFAVCVAALIIGETSKKRGREAYPGPLTFPEFTNRSVKRTWTVANCVSLLLFVAIPVALILDLGFGFQILDVFIPALLAVCAAIMLFKSLAMAFADIGSPSDGVLNTSVK